jgi:hypothetical protein
MDNLESGLAAIQDNYDAAVTAATVETDDATLETEPAVEVQDAATDADETEVAEETEAEVEDSTDETDESAPEVEEVSDDSFDDLLDDIPSNEAILNAHKRIPQATKDALVQYADGWRQTKQQIDSIGGEQGLKILAPLSATLTKAEITEADSYDALAPLLVTNPTAMVDVLMYASENVLFNTDPAFKPMAAQGDKVLQNRFGDGYTAERIEKLVALEQSGYIDSNVDFETLQAQGVDSDLFQTQQQKLTDADTRIKELENLVSNPHLIEQKSAQQTNALKDLDTELTQRVNQSVTPFRERGRWAETSPLTTLVTENILNTLKNTPEYKEAVKFVSQYGTLKQGDAIPYTIQTKLDTLSRMAKGKFGELVSAINKERRVVDESSTNAQVAKKVKETVPKAEVMTPTETYIPGAPTALQSELDKIYKNYHEAVAGAR